MTDALKLIITKAADDLDSIIQQGAHLLLHSLSNSNAPIVKAVLGFGQQQQPDSLPITCLVNYSNPPQSNTIFLDFPVLIHRSLLFTVKAYYVALFQAQQQRLTVLAEHSTKPPHSSTDSLESSPHVTRLMITDKSAPFIALSWLCSPQNECLIGHRRRWLHDSLCVPEADMTSIEKTQLLIKEIIILDLLLSICPKLKSLWEYRLWIVKHIFNSHLLTAAAAEADSLDLLLFRWQQQDDACFFSAAHNHSMNYNAWHYRRCARKAFYASFSTLPQALEISVKLTRCDSQRVIHFIREHNGDTSAMSYLLFMLHEEDVSDQMRASQNSRTTTLRRPETSQGLTRPTENHMKFSSDYPSALQLWKYFMCFTQEEIRRHCEKGHEAMWYLRLELTRWAVTKASCIDISSAWSVEDELEWVSTYVAAVSSTSPDTLLSPTSGIPHVWTESFGSLAWTSYNAARYGLELLSILGRPNKWEKAG
ncbi:hypothetical protein ABL78_6629 [Leptomonas seymouri]|uniref:Uncharacterized protein n=1 Tax=Leptomonas seymouri TaxID=5684 RepID=A0A0N1HTJ1_LEPSE|nr:hypothetical protein ABL78_6629 [Leptomonas seymouri]|eukprot:KPI84323.1 hypothetical protein ABL78_6629 [Leptomonas seymouri]